MNLIYFFTCGGAGRSYGAIVRFFLAVHELFGSCIASMRPITTSKPVSSR